MAIIIIDANPEEKADARITLLARALYEKHMRLWEEVSRELEEEYDERPLAKVIPFRKKET